MHPAEYVAAKMDHFLQTVTDAFPDLSILVIGPPELGSLEMGDMDWQFSFQAARQMNLLFHLAAEKRGLSYVDAAAWNLPLAYDGVHLSEEGHRVFAAQMEKWLRENN